MSDLSAQQRTIVDRPLGRLCVTACAGSGKTRTVVHRVAKICELVGEVRGRVALLSFSNVAVDTFQKDYRSLAQRSLLGKRAKLVDIATFDSFFTINVVKPHGHHVMGSKCLPYLVQGGEPFLAGFTFKTGKFPQRMDAMSATVEAGKWAFYSSFMGNKTKIDAAVAVALVTRLGKTGAYTHELGRYWAYRVLQEQEHVLRALVRRYPQIIIDEAQDIGPAHQALLEMLQTAGCTISLVGDANQGIFEFNGADGKFLTGYHGAAGVDAQELTINYRSVPAILKVANSLTGRDDEPDRDVPASLNGAYFTPLKNGGEADLRKLFNDMLAKAEVPQEKAVILCRGNEWVNQWRGAEPDQGRGPTKHFAQAAILRDKDGNFDRAFTALIRGLLDLLKAPPPDLAARLRRPGTDTKAKALRQLLWKFLRDDATGLPSASLNAATQWQPSLVKRSKELLEKIEETVGLAPADNLGKRLTKAFLQEAPLVTHAPDDQIAIPQMRVETVHGVKGESIDAVMYVASKEHVKELIAGPATEVGRIGYVAVTRARNLFLLAIPEKDLDDFRPSLIAHGFVEHPAQQP
ncbi:ATP-dependent helicase [Neorhizobium sp. CSC1952]|uniref:UvrD-helicase domain-containing protein n=1 Tax=Neorhizobium sp. CSC1952 TaxID=2978974 RepID=UPI0025A685B8|nr:ATP-dependent helicase [Rhizobium sp. CSC1952]WJR67104.1 ATP-dependent helicase [Rhizobium sp. CSC1952]